MTDELHSEGYDPDLHGLKKADDEYWEGMLRVPITREDERRALDKGMAEECAKGWRKLPPHDPSAHENNDGPLLFGNLSWREKLRVLWRHLTSI